jgi:NADH:ubiquinone oxidoreductase subunit F (NADH-binding)
MITALDPLRTPPVPAGSTAAIPVGWLGQPRLFAGADRRDLTSYPNHLAEHGPLATPSSAVLLALLDTARLTGRGGAAFPLAAKIRALRPRAGAVVVVNGCEGEPSSAKDAALLSRVPHQVLDGAAVLAAAVDARRVFVAVTDPGVEVAVRTALAGRPDRDRFEVHRLPDRFVSGEARALIAGLNGDVAVPPGRRTLPTDHGVGGAPTVLSNAETFAQLATLVRLGPDEFARRGASPRDWGTSLGGLAEPGTVLLTVTGAVRRPGVVEVPYGVELSALAEVVGAQPSQAVVIGGYHGGWLRPDPKLVLSKAGVAAAGGTLGAGAVMFVGDQTCALSELARVAGWLAEQSARSCGPCAFGLPALAEDVRALAAGRAGTAVAAGRAGTAVAAGRAGTAVAERHARMVTGRGACAHPDGAARFVLSGLATLADEVRTHQSNGSCGRADQAHLPMTRAQAFGGIR